MQRNELLIFGQGYSGAAIAQAARARFAVVTGTARDPAGRPGLVGFQEAQACLETATHVLSSVPPDAQGDPVLAAYGSALAAAPNLRWIGYLSSTGVYGNRDGGWVDEATPVAPTSQRGRRRAAAEAQWAAHAARCAVDIFRLAGIYGPGRSTFDELRAGRARRVIKPGHAFGRIHRDDIAGAVLAAMQQDGPRPGGARILNLADDLPAQSEAVIAEAAALLAVPVPAAVPFAEAEAAMSPMARSFWADNRRVASQATQAALGYRWRYPTYREGLGAILAEERLERVAKQGEIGGA